MKVGLFGGFTVLALSGYLFRCAISQFSLVLFGCFANGGSSSEKQVPPVSARKGLTRNISYVKILSVTLFFGDSGAFCCSLVFSAWWVWSRKMRGSFLPILRYPSIVPVLGGRPGLVLF